MERSSVRIDVVVPFEAQVISEEELAEREARMIGIVSYFSYFPLKEVSDEALNEWLKLINAKLDFIINCLIRGREGFNSLPQKKINLSEGGCKFYSDFSLEVETPIEVKIILDLYEPIAFYLYGRVKRCEPKEGGYEIALEWVNLTPDIQEKLGFYILQKEREYIRRTKGL